MQLTGTERARHLTLAGALVLGAGVVTTSVALVAYGSALLGGVALCRALALLSVAHARAAGFEMLWRTRGRSQRVARLGTVELSLELRNRDALPTRYRGLRVLHSPGLAVRATPSAGVVPARGRLVVTLEVRALRVGYHGVHGLVLETIRAPGLHTVPLAFTNPLVLEVLPRSARLSLPAARGAQSDRHSPDSRSRRLPGDGPELAELREHRPGDPFRRIAWKASARRGRLLVVETEAARRGAAWLVLDAAVDNFAGEPGRAPIDQAVDLAARLAEEHLGEGDLVGLSVLAARELAHVPLGRGPSHAARLLAALAYDVHTADADRSDWDPRDVEHRALEHARALDAEAAGLLRGDLPHLLELTRELGARAPVSPPLPWGRTPADQRLRGYLMAFGVQPPPRLTSDRHLTELHLASRLRRLAATRPRPTVVYLLARPPTYETPRSLLDAVSELVARRVAVRFVPLLEELPRGATAPAARLASAALTARQALAAELGRAELTRRGARVLRLGPAQSPDTRRIARSIASTPSTTTRTS